MHELSIALSIMDIVRDELTKSGSQKVTEVVIEVGDLSGIDAVALTTCLEVATRDSFMQDAVIQLRRHPGKGFCEDCQIDFPMSNILDLCPDCGRAASQIIEGNEMQIPSMMVVD